MARAQVRVIAEPRVARFLVDPTKRQILRHLAERELTQKMLGDLIGISDPSVHYHLKELKRAGLVRVVRSEPEAHGILQKFYEASACYMIADYPKMPLELRRYFLAVNLERLRGVFAILRALRGVRVSLSSGEMEKVADRVAFSLVDVARQYEDRTHSAGDREPLITELYGEALRRVIEDDPASVAPLSSVLSNLGLRGRQTEN